MNGAAWLIAAAVAIGSAGVAAQERGAPRSATAMRTIDKGTQSNIDGPRQAVMRTDAEWSALWKQHNFDRPLPKVDFAREMVLAVFLGSRPTGGFSIEIVDVAPRDGTVVVTYRERSPGRDSMTAQVLTSPYHIVAVPKAAGDVKFEKSDSK